VNQLPPMSDYVSYAANLMGMRAMHVGAQRLLNAAQDKRKTYRQLRQLGVPKALLDHSVKK
jgi:hypothetical protein